MSSGEKDKLREDFLYTDISPEFSRNEEKTINECFREELSKSDRVEISVAYCSCDSLRELDRLAEILNIKYICLILGMYFFIGLLEDLYELILEINQKWTKRGRGEIRLTHSFKHHGKLYCFYKNNQIFSVIMGSPNLSFLDEAQQRRPRQYEIAWLSNDPFYLENSQKHIERLKLKSFSDNIVALKKYRSDGDEKPKERKRNTKSKITFKKNV